MKKKCIKNKIDFKITILYNAYIKNNHGKEYNRWK